MEYHGGMSEKTRETKMCNADRSQRKRCVYFHEKTGRCSRPADESTWQSRAAARDGDVKD